MRVSPKTIQALSLFVPKVDPRGYLLNIYFELQLDRTILTARDGASLLAVCIDAPNEKEDTFKISPACFLKSSICYDVTRADDGKVYVNNGPTSVEVPQDGVAYPDFRRVVPAKEALLELKQYDPELLLRFKKASKLLGGQMFPFVHSNSVVDIGLPNVVGFLMPIRTQGCVYPNVVSPAWLAVKG